MNFDSSTGYKVSLSKLFNQPVLFFLYSRFAENLIAMKRRKAYSFQLVDDGVCELSIMFDYSNELSENLLENIQYVYIYNAVSINIL